MAPRSTESNPAPRCQSHANASPAVNSGVMLTCPNTLAAERVAHGRGGGESAARNQIAAVDALRARGVAGGRGAGGPPVLIAARHLRHEAGQHLTEDLGGGE